MPVKQEDLKLAIFAGGLLGGLAAVTWAALKGDPPAPLDRLVITSPYGAPRESGLHGGVDIRAPEGTPIRAPFDGVFGHFRADRPGFGGSLSTQDGTTILLGHLSAYCRPDGDWVEAGDILALSGKTGHTNGPHVHLEALRHGVRVDPVALFPDWPWEAA